MATPMTASQLERFAQAHRRVSGADPGRPRPARKLTWSPAGDLDYQFRAILPAEAAAVVFQALRAARNDLEHPHDDHHDDDGEHDHADGGDRDVSAETRLGRLGRRDAESGTSFFGAQPPPAEMEPAENLADALVQICADYLGARAATADNPDTYQVIIHAGARAATGAEPAPGPAQAAAPDPVGAETPGPQPRAAEPAPPGLPFWHPAHEDRCHLDDGPAISPATLALIGCNATISTMIHDLSGAIIDVGRRTRKPPPALRRALRERDRGRCQYPGCDCRRTDAHHILYWANGGETNLADLISFCKRHHRIVHEKNIIIAATAAGFAFHTKDGTPIPTSPPLPEPDGGIERGRVSQHHHPRQGHCRRRRHRRPAIAAADGPGDPGGLGLVDRVHAPPVHPGPQHRPGVRSGHGTSLLPGGRPSSLLAGHHANGPPRRQRGAARQRTGPDQRAAAVHRRLRDNATVTAGTTIIPPRQPSGPSTSTRTHT